MRGTDGEPLLSRLRRLLFEALGLASDATLLGAQPFVQLDHPWRGTRRPVDLYFEVVRELGHERLRGRAGVPVLVLGMPFDPRGRPPVDHLAHAAEFSEDGAAGGVVWQPSYLSDRAMRELGTLVRIDELMKDGRLAEAARMLSASDREQARAVLQSQQSALHQRLRACLDAAYGIRPDADGCIGTPAPSEGRLVSLDSFRPQMPVGATMRDAVAALLDRMFAYRFPAHPHFDQPVQVSALRKVLEQVQAAAQVEGQRLFVEDPGTRRTLALLAGPLKLGTMNQTHLLLSPHWADHFSRMHAKDGGDGAPTVARLREWTDKPDLMGLTPEVQNLVVLAFAAQADRSLIRNSAPATGSIDRLDDAVELREQVLPDEVTWARARARASALFGLVPGEVRKGATMARLAAELRTKAAEASPVLARLSQDLEPHTAIFDVGAGAPRLVTLRSAQVLLSALSGANGDLATINSLAAADPATSEAAVGRCLGSAADLSAAVAATLWNVILPAVGLSDGRRAAAEGLRARLAEALSADEHALPLRPVLRDAQERASRLLAEQPPPRVNDPPFEPPPPPPPSPGEEVVGEGDRLALDAADAAVLLDGLRDQLAAAPGARLAIRWRLTQRAGGDSD